MTQDGWLAFKGTVVGHAALGAVLVASVLGTKFEESSRHCYYFSVELSPDGRRLVRSVDESLRVEEIGSGRILHEDRGMCAPAFFSKDGRRLAYLKGAGDRKPGYRVVDLELGKVRFGETADLVAMGPGGWPLVLADRGFSDGWPEKHAISLQHADAGAPGGRFLPFEGSLPEHFHIEEIVFSPDGSLLAIGGTEANQGRHRLVLWDLREDHRLWERRADASLVGLAFSPDGSLLAVGCGAFERGEILFLDPWSGEDRRRWSRQEFLGGPLEFSPDGSLVAFGGYDAGLLEVGSCTLRWTVPSGKGKVRSVRFVEDILRVADEPGFVRDLDLSSGRAVAVRRRPPAEPVHPRLWVAAAGSAVWLALWGPLWRRASRLRGEATPYSPRFAGKLLLASVIYLVASIVGPLSSGGMIDLGVWLMLILLQFAGLLIFLFAGLGFLILRVPFRKRGFFGGFPLAACGVGVQLWIWAAICASV